MNALHETDCVIDGKAVGRRIAQIRQSLRFTQAQLAEYSGLTQGTISRIENAVHGAINLESLVRIARTLRVTSSELLGETNPIDDPKIREVTYLMQHMPEYKKDVSVATNRTLAGDNTSH